MTSVWIVSGSEYDDHGPVAAFTTQELAEAYAAPKQFTVDEFTVHDRLPTLVKRHLQAATVMSDGAVRRGGGRSQEFWDSETPEPLLLVRGSQDTQVIVWQEDAVSAERTCLEEVKAVLGGIFEEQQHPVQWLVEAIENARQLITPSTPMPPRPACYEASWGWVHVRPGCRCAAARR